MYLMLFDMFDLIFSFYILFYITYGSALLLNWYFGCISNELRLIKRKKNHDLISSKSDKKQIFTIKM